jgi:drug/metabolite transporter (DMT)-like permease
VNRSVVFGLAAAALFGVSTPLAKLLTSEVAPLLLGGLLYLGSGIGLGVARLVRDRGWKSSGLSSHEWSWLLGAILFGGVLGPVALMVGLRSTTGSAASLLLNLESVLTALLAWIVFKENAGRRVVLGMAAIVAGGVVLSWPTDGSGSSTPLGLLAVVTACLCWAIDNNLTRKVSASDAMFVAGAKGLIAGAVNCAAAHSAGIAAPATTMLLAAMLVGLFGYGISLVLFVLALRGLGAARTGAYFAIAPFLGAAVALALLGERTSSTFWVACGLMAFGVWLHLTEQHEHEHTHEPLEHGHAHVHDAHHQHEHDSGWDGSEPHTHVHTHSVVTHKHPHYPDVHHRHAH